MVTKAKALVHRAVNVDRIRLFDDRQIELPGWTLKHQVAIPIGKPTAVQTQSALAFAAAAADSSPYWIGDIVGYCENRSEYREKLDQILTVLDTSEGRVQNLVSVAGRVAPRERAISQSVNHSAIVASMDADEQHEWLDRSRTEGWNERELRLEVRAAKRRGIIKGQAELSGQFRVFYVDCPWTYGDYQTGAAGAKEHYPGMSVDELMKLPIAAHAQKNAVMFFWVTSPMLYYASDPALGPNPYRVLRAWGFEPKTGMVWDKVKHNFGNYVSVRHEHLIIATRGSCTPDRPTPMPDSVITEQRTDTHSEKPQIFRKVIEKLYDGPYVELFARKPVKGWTTWGNQVLSDVTAR